MINQERRCHENRTLPSEVDQGFIRIDTDDNRPIEANLPNPPTISQNQSPTSPKSSTTSDSTDHSSLSNAPSSLSNNLSNLRLDNSTTLTPGPLPNGWGKCIIV